MKLISKRYHIVSILIIVPLILFSCKDNSVNSDIGKKGVMMIQISLWDENPDLVVLKEGVSLSLEGTSFTAMTDSSGTAILKDIPSGVYTIVASYPGYISTKWMNYNLESDTLRTFLSISKLPTFSVKTLNIVTSNDSISFSGQVSNAVNYKRLVMVYLGKDSTASNVNWQYGLGVYVNALDSTFHFSDAGVPIKLNGFPISGMKVYTASYGMGGGSYIYNHSSGHTIRVDVSTVVNKSNFVMP